MVMYIILRATSTFGFWLKVTGTNNLLYTVWVNLYKKDTFEFLGLLMYSAPIHHGCYAPTMLK